MRSIFVRRSATISSGVIGRATAGAGSAGCRRPEPRRRLRSRRHRARRPPASGWRARPRRSSSATSAATSSSEACTDSTHDDARCVRSDFGRRARDVELRRLGADRLERAPGLSNAAFEFLEASAQRLRRFVGHSHEIAQLVERPQPGIQHRLRGRDRFDAGRSGAIPFAADRRCASGFASRAPREDSSRRCTSSREGARALDQRGVRRLRFRRARRLRLHRLARLEQAALGGIQLIVGRPLLRLNPRDRLPRLFLPRVLGAKLLFRRAALGCDLILLPANALDGFRSRVRHLQIEPDTRLLQPVQLALQREDGGLDRAAIDTSSDAISFRRRSTAAPSVSARSRSSLISRRVVRMPRASARVPPSTTCAPRNTSPSSVTIARVRGSPPRAAPTR